MQPFTRILVPTDFSACADKALLHAIELARAFEAELHLLHVIAGPEGIETQGIPGKDAFYRELEASAARLLAGLIPEETRAPLTIRHTTRRAAAPAPAILDYADEHAIDLIVMGTHGRQGAERFLIGSTAEKVTRVARCTVLTVGPHGGRVVPLARRILVPMDFSPSARKALVRAKDLAARYPAHLLVLHVIEPVLRPVFYDDHPDALAVHVPKLEARAYEELEQVYRKTRGPSVRATFHVVRGRPAHEITAFAEREDVHLIVQGTHGLAGTPYLMLGSVAEKVVRTAPCPVLTVKATAATRRRRAAATTKPLANVERADSS